MGIIPYPPRAPDHRSSRWDPSAGYLESSVLATIHMWMLKHNKDEIVGHIVRNFLATDVHLAMCELNTSVGKEKPPGHRDTAGRSAAELYASELCDMMSELTSANKLPKIVVSSMCLGMVPVAVLKTSDEMSVNARLESMEVGMKKVTDALVKLTAEQARKQPTFTGGPSQVGHLGGQQTPQLGSAETGHLKVPSAPEQELRSWAAAAAAGTGDRVQQPGVVGGQGRPRLGSIGNPQKRARQEEKQQQQEQQHVQDQQDKQFQEVQTRNQQRKQRKVAYGCSQVNIEEEGSAAPVEFYVGNTTPRATKEIIESVLIKCAKGVETETLFSVVEVQQLATHIVNPRTKCWKVVVPYKYKQLMEKDELYPSGWTHRKFFGPRKSKENNTAREDDKLVTEVMNEQERKQAEERRVSEEGRLREEAAKLENDRKRKEEEDRQLGQQIFESVANSSVAETSSGAGGSQPI